MQEAYRQGEILFIKVALSAEAVKAIKEHSRAIEGGVIREGETTGHKHVVNGGVLQTLETRHMGYMLGEGIHEYINLPEGEMFLSSDDKITITHPEHKELTLDKGAYVVRIQREYDEADKYRRVSD